MVNLINTKHLTDHGVKHGALFFCASVHPNGFPAYSKVWGMTKETEPLRDELRERLAEARFVSAICDHHPVYAGFYGTLTFSVTDGKPHVRIFANQQLQELQKESDFITPQMISVPGHIYDFTKVKDPFGTWATDDKPVVADMSMSISASGKVTDIHLQKVMPPDKEKYAASAVETLKQRTWLPAYRNGKPVDSTTTFRYYFVPAYFSLQ